MEKQKMITRQLKEKKLKTNKKLLATMAINNCYYWLILKIPTEFSACRVLAKVSVNPRNCS